MIKLSGKEPEKDILLKYTGLRPGEKLYEELLSDDAKIFQHLTIKLWFLWTLIRNIMK